MLADELNMVWLARRGSIAIDPLMRFTDKGLMLGAGTILARSGDSSRDISIDPTERRFCALLTAAHLGRPSISGLAHLRKAADCWRERQDALAAMHLVVSRLNRLEEPEADAYRLFLGDSLMSSGVEPDAVIAALESSAAEPLGKFDPNQPRVPAGSGRPSGEWTSGGASGGSSSTATRSGTPQRQGAAHAPRAGRQRQSPRSPRVAVNPDTITPIAGGGMVVGAYACRQAAIDCVRHAVEDSRRGAANDNWEINTIIACKETEAACDRMSIETERLPKARRGFALFPDGGVVLTAKGRNDVYIPAVGRRRFGPFK